MFPAVSSSLLLLGFAVVSAVGVVQKPIVVHAEAHSPYDAGLFSPMEDLSLLSTSDFTTLGHPLFPNYSVRIKKSDFCDGTVNAYTGYIDVEARHLFFYFFESRSKPEEDDVIFWTNGGPGCSSSAGLFMELGPCRVNDVHNVTFNPYSWNEKANVFFIDQPIGVGFSYADHGEYVSTTEEAAVDVASFVAIFFEHFGDFKGRPFHMAGESAGGRFIPVFASAVYEQNAKLIAAGATPVNLDSAMIGNGCTDWKAMMSSWYTLMCQPTHLDPISDISTCVGMKQRLSRCEKWFQEACYDTSDAINCNAALAFCATITDGPFYAAGLNPYDITKPCTPEELEDSLCYPIMKKMSAFLDRPDIRKTIGVDASRGNFSMCNMEVNARFEAKLDHIFPTQLYISALLERGVRVLIYVGANDWSCNWVGNERMTLALEWTGQEEFAAQPLREWKVGGQKAGLTRSAGPLTFVTIDGAGHMAPYDKGEESLEIVKRWLAKEEL